MPLSIQLPRCGRPDRDRSFPLCQILVRIDMFSGSARPTRTKTMHGDPGYYSFKSFGLKQPVPGGHRSSDDGHAGLEDGPQHYFAQHDPVVQE